MIYPLTVNIKKVVLLFHAKSDKGQYTLCHSDGDHDENFMSGDIVYVREAALSSNFLP